MADINPLPRAQKVAHTLAVGDDTPRRRSWVPCPRSHTTVSLEHCELCKQLTGLVRGQEGEVEAVVCHADAPDESNVPPYDRPLELPRLTVSDLMTRNVVCVRPHLTLDTVVQLFLETGLKAVPVVDEAGKVLGMVSHDEVQLDIHARRDESARQPGWVERGSQTGRSSEPPSRTVADVMMPVAFTIAEHASVLQAAALLVYESLGRVAVVSTRGEVVGVLSASDILQWLAQADGYALPSRR